LRAQLEEAIRCADALRNELERLNQTTAVTLPPPRGAITTTAQRHSVRFEDEAAMATTAAQRRSVHFEDDQMNITPPRSMIQPLTLPTQSESVMSEPSIGSTEEEEFAVSVQASSAPQRGDDEDDSVDMADQHDSINMADDDDSFDLEHEEEVERRMKEDEDMRAGDHIDTMLLIWLQETPEQDELQW